MYSWYMHLGSQWRNRLGLRLFARMQPSARDDGVAFRLPAMQQNAQEEPHHAGHLNDVKCSAF